MIQSTLWDGMRFRSIPQTPPILLQAALKAMFSLKATTTGNPGHLNERLGKAQASWSSIVFVPSDPAVVYAGIAGYYSAGTFDSPMPGKGIYKSIDGGKTWKPSNDELTQDAHVTALAVNPQDPNMLFAATANHGLLKTSTAGQAGRKCAMDCQEPRLFPLPSIRMIQALWSRV